MSMYGLGTVLLVAAGTGRYGVAGAVAAAGCPARPAAPRRWPSWPTGTVSGGGAAPAGDGVRGHRRGADRGGGRTCMRRTGCCSSRPCCRGRACRRWARWSGPGGTTCWPASPQLHTAFSFESVADELVFVLGPAVVTVLSTEVFPAAGLLVATAACVAGVLWFVAQRATEPPPVTVPVRSASSGDAPPARTGGARTDRPGAGVRVPGRDVRVDRPEHGRVRPALRAQGAGRA